jgi:hypothetical protein
MSKLVSSLSPPQAGQSSRPDPVKAVIPRITPQARRYAVRELARRAGVAREFFDKWLIEVTSDRTTISFGPDIHGEIRFPHSSTDLPHKRETIPVTHASWPQERDYSTQSDLILPFCEAATDSVVPLYRITSLGGLSCTSDLLRSILFTLSRTEETLCPAFDEHGRFPASSSVALIHDFLERPILDEHGLAFQHAISSVIPRWRPEPRNLRVKLTHDIDDVGIPFGFRTSLAHTAKRRRPAATLRDLLSTVSAVIPAELAQVRRLAAISASRSLHSAFYWKAATAGPRDSGYDTKHRKMRRVIDALQERGCELGVHPGYDTFANRGSLLAEVDYLRESLGADLVGGRQHYLRWNPDTWRDWEWCGLLYDSSVGFAERFGFRAGTALPYRPWCFAENRELNLIEVPLILMDCTPVKYMKMGKAEGLQRIQSLIHRVEESGGVFTLLWHNTPLLDPDYDGWYESILNMLSGAQRYDLPQNAANLW